ncbi:MAG: lactonase family protein [Myxococcota bacterium]
MPGTPRSFLVYISSFSEEDPGIQAARMDAQTGRLELLRRTTDTTTPFFLALSSCRRFLYAIDEYEQGGVAAFERVDDDGGLVRLNRQPASDSACYLSVDVAGTMVFTATYAAGDIFGYPVRPDGSLGAAGVFVHHQGSSVTPERQAASHPHAIVPSPDNRHVYVVDLGMDVIHGYRFDAERGALTQSEPPIVRTAPAAGPRHMEFHPSAPWVYVINEISDTITHYDYDSASGALHERKTLSTLPPGYDEVTDTADIKITPSGRFLYGTNRGHDSIAVFQIGDSGELALVDITEGVGRGPQHLAMSPDGSYLLCSNMPGDTIVVYRIDDETGRLSRVGDPIPMARPSCAVFV